METIWAWPVSSWKRTRERAALRWTMGLGSLSIGSRAWWNSCEVLSWPITQASVTRISSMGSFERATICGYHLRTVVSPRSMRVSNCASTCWISRGWERSARAFEIWESVMGRPNQVAFQNKNGMMTKARVRTTMARAQRPPKDFCGLAVESAVVLSPEVVEGVAGGADDGAAAAGFGVGAGAGAA